MNSTRIRGGLAAGGRREDQATSHPKTEAPRSGSTERASSIDSPPPARRDVLFVDGTLGGKKVRGGLRLLVEGCKQVFYTPLVNPEGEEASRFLRTIWFDRKFNE
jgi:hypothetical protein